MDPDELVPIALAYSGVDVFSNPYPQPVPFDEAGLAVTPVTRPTAGVPFMHRPLGLGGDPAAPLTPGYAAKLWACVGAGFLGAVIPIWFIDKYLLHRGRVKGRRGHGLLAYAALGAAALVGSRLATFGTARAFFGSGVSFGW